MVLQVDPQRLYAQGSLLRRAGTTAGAGAGALASTVGELAPASGHPGVAAAAATAARSWREALDLLGAAVAGVGAAVVAAAETYATAETSAAVGPGTSGAGVGVQQ